MPNYWLMFLFGFIQTEFGTKISVFGACVCACVCDAAQALCAALLMTCQLWLSERTFCWDRSRHCRRKNVCFSVTVSLLASVCSRLWNDTTGQRQLFTSSLLHCRNNSANPCERKPPWMWNKRACSSMKTMNLEALFKRLRLYEIYHLKPLFWKENHHC